MASVVFYFQIHQPFRLRRYSVFDSDPFYFDAVKNAEVCRKVADKCYRPMTRLLLEMVRQHDGRFRVAFSITGTALEQLAEHAPDVIDLLRELAGTGCCEFLGETYHHSLSFLYSRDEFVQQVALHDAKVREVFGQTPTVFRNTELIFSNDVARFIASIKDKRGQPKYAGVLCEGADHLLGARSPGFVYRTPGMAPTPATGHAGKAFGLLLKNHRLSDDIAFRFSNRAWTEWPLTPEKIAAAIDRINGHGQLCNLFMDYETFGEHQWADTGIFEFFRALPAAVLNSPHARNEFLTPSQALAKYDASGEYDAPQMTSWADTERDLSAWVGNAMQSNALSEVYRLEPLIRARAEAGTDDNTRRLSAFILDDWRKLTTSDHYYYMCTKYFADGDVHKYFSPYDSPYDAYINFMNVLDNLRARAGA